VKRVVEELVDEGVILSADHEVSLVTRHRYAYVIDDIARNENIATIMKHLEESGIMTCGRFAEFEYLNMDGIVARAFDFVNTHTSELDSAGR
jgi:UDP-galactopyranose mutase